MLDLVESDGCSMLANELVTLRATGKKNNDDLVDALRYAIASVPWSFEGVTGEKLIVLPKRQPTEDELRRGLMIRADRSEERGPVVDEINEWNELIGSGGDYDW